MVNVEVAFAFVFVDVDFEMRDFVFELADEEEVVGGQDLELFPLFVVVLLCLRSTEKLKETERKEGLRLSE